MPLHPTWDDFSLRLALTVFACALLGLDRGARGHAAGLRTTLLVGLSAAVALMLANSLLAQTGKAKDSFIQLDLMRLPLGVLTGVGFIGGGAILKKGEMITGVTTAATLWVATMIGFCFGAGQLLLGGVAAALAFATLFGLKQVDGWLPRIHRARLTVEAPADASASQVAEVIAAARCDARFLSQQRDEDSLGRVHLGFEVQWKQSMSGGPPLDLLRRVQDRFEIVSFEVTAEPM